jgi:hypothetical protein
MRARVWQPTVTAQYYYAWPLLCPFISAVRALDTLATYCRDYIYIFYIDPHRAQQLHGRRAARAAAGGLAVRSDSAASDRFGSVHADKDQQVALGHGRAQ